MRFGFPGSPPPCRLISDPTLAECPSFALPFLPLLCLSPAWPISHHPSRSNSSTTCHLLHISKVQPLQYSKHHTVLALTCPHVCRLYWALWLSGGRDPVATAFVSPGPSRKPDLDNAEFSNCLLNVWKEIRAKILQKCKILYHSLF